MLFFLGNPPAPVFIGAPLLYVCSYGWVSVGVCGCLFLQHQHRLVLYVCKLKRYARPSCADPLKSQSPPVLLCLTIEKKSSVVGDSFRKHASPPPPPPSIFARNIAPPGVSLARSIVPKPKLTRRKNTTTRIDTNTTNADRPETEEAPTAQTSTATSSSFSSFGGRKGKGKSKSARSKRTTTTASASASSTSLDTAAQAAGAATSSESCSGTEGSADSSASGTTTPAAAKGKANVAAAAAAAAAAAVAGVVPSPNRVYYVVDPKEVMAQNQSFMCPFLARWVWWLVLVIGGGLKGAQRRSSCLLF